MEESKVSKDLNSTNKEIAKVLIALENQIINKKCIDNLSIINFLSSKGRKEI